jgi:hypothetical protein
VHFFLDKKVPKKSRLCIVSPACSQLCLWSGRGRTGKARMPRISKLALVRGVLRFPGWVAVCFCGLVAWFLAQTLICFTGILAFPVLNATRPRGKPGAERAGRERCRWVWHFYFGNIETPINKTNFFFEFDYHYKNALSIKIIEGDTSDNLVGIKGIKSTTLLKHFPEMKFKQFTVREICKRADEINKERVENKKKPLKAFESLLSSIERLKINHKLMNLSEPFLNDDAEEELGQLIDMPLSDEDRNSKNLIKLMKEDEFLSVYGGTFANYIEPFYPVIMNEKQMYKDYLKKDKNLI